MDLKIHISTELGLHEDAFRMRTKIHENNQIFRSPKKSILSNFDFLGLVFGEKVYKGMKNDIIKLKFKFLLF